MFKLNIIFKSIFAFSVCLASMSVMASQDPFIANFNNKDVGIAFTMLSKEHWKNPGGQNFHTNPTDGLKVVQAITISNASKEIWPYPADSRYGLALSIASDSDFYKYFATKSQFKQTCTSNKAKLIMPIKHKPASTYSSITNWAVSCGGNEQIAFCGRCSDGGACAGSGTKPATSSGLWPVLGDQVSYAEFNKAKNAIVTATGKTCPWINTPNAWNEFDTNGLSPTALQGVIIDGITPGNDRSWKPKKSTLCTYFKNADPGRNEWAQYKLISAGPNTGKSKLIKIATVTCP